MCIFAGPTAQRRVISWATIPLSNQLPVYCDMFQILFTVSVRGGPDPSHCSLPMMTVAPGRAQGLPEVPKVSPKIPWDGPGGYLACPWSPPVRPKTSQGRPGTPRDSPDTSQVAPGTSQDLLGPPREP